MKSILITFLLAGLVSMSMAALITFQDVIQAEFAEFKDVHGKEYKDEQEESYRMKIFMDNKHKIARHNQKAARGDKSFTMAMNHFGDLLQHEFKALMNGFSNKTRPTTRENPIFMAPNGFNAPTEIDYRKLGYVTPIKNQGHCGSCWAFSTTGALEGQNYRKTKELISLSEQNLVDCSSKYGNNGCNGGLMDNAFTYIKENKGIDTETSYPYHGKDEKCHFMRQDVGAKDIGFVDIPQGSESHLMQAVAANGPVSVAIDASHESFQFYHEGVYDEEECSSEDLDHGVLVVGYGTEKSNDFWIVKNSWGTKWGRDGYVMMARNKANQCGIASSASYPLV